jgi:hypothetical protein
MTALTESPLKLKTKIVKSGPYADKVWNRIQIIQEKIKNKAHFKIGKEGNGPKVYGVSFDPKTDIFTYTVSIKGTGKKIQVSRTKIFKDKDLGGGGGARGGSDVTDVAESMQCYYNAWYFRHGENAKPPNEDQLKSTTIIGKCYTTTSAKNCLESKLITSWFEKEVFIKIAKKLTKKYKPLFGSTPSFHRGSKFMKDLYKAKKLVHKRDIDSATSDSPAQAPGTFGDDKWNPGDIWITNFPMSDKPLDHATCNWGEINAEVEKLADNGKLLGVSLKKVEGSVAKWKEFNRKINIKNKGDQQYTGFSFGQRGLFFGSIDCYLTGTYSKTQFRATQTDKSWQGELSSQSAAGGKIGGGNVNFYLKDVFEESLWTSGEGDARAKVSKLDNAFFEEYWALYQRFVLEPISTRTATHKDNPKTKEEFTSAFDESTYSFKFSKYLCLKMLEIMYNGTSTQRKKFINLLYFYAASNTDQSSYFVKISDEGA